MVKSNRVDAYTPAAQSLLATRSKEWLNRSYPRNGEALPFYPYGSPVYQFNQLLREVRR